MKRWTTGRYRGIVDSAVLRSGQRSLTTTAQEAELAVSQKPNKPDNANQLSDENGTRTFRPRSGHRKHIPLPPFMDPKIQEARNRWRAPKPEPDLANLTPFQKKLYANPYAHALATPVRQCQTTQTRLPSFFFVSLYAQQHPETKDVWLLPLDLFRETSSKVRSLGVPTRYVSLKAFLDYLKHRGRWKGRLGLRLNERLEYLIRENRVVWREDMSDLVLKLLRDAAWRRLRPILLNKGDRMVQDVETVESYDDVACIIHTEPLFVESRRIGAKLNQWIEWADRATRDITDMADEIRKRRIAARDISPLNPGSVIPRLRTSVRYHPLEFPTTTRGGKTIALYSLTDLLGEEKAFEIMQSTRWKETRCVVLKHTPETRNAQMWLMKLQGYLAGIGP